MHIIILVFSFVTIALEQGNSVRLWHFNVISMGLITVFKECFEENSMLCEK